MSRTIVIGDLHGCHDEALDLLDALHVTSSDRVIFAGDLVDRGPKPRECVELAMKHGRGLTALLLPEWELKTVPTRDYSGGRKTVASYPVHDDVMAFS